MKKIGVIGSGQVGQVLADGFLKLGYAVMRGARDPKKLESWKAAAGVSATTGNFEQTATFGELVVLAVKGIGAEEAVALCGEKALSGKTVIDTTNPIGTTPPQNGVLSFFTGPNESLMERLQEKAPGAHFVKAFSSVGAARMENPQFAGGQPSMFICGNDAGAKAEVSAILARFGWETEDMGTAAAARAIEPLCILWCIPGLLHNQWTHAFKLLKR